MIKYFNFILLSMTLGTACPSKNKSKVATTSIEYVKVIAAEYGLEDSIS